MNEIRERFDRIEGTLLVLTTQNLVRDGYDTKTFAAKVGKSPYTVRQWCLHGRIRAEKRRFGRALRT